ncbi:kinase-like domain-containing protein [Hygrophoropsis aurantiaca]|uniref:Kinase-like domain-containing protein n=1 Tax=Hygrophoropsis aurantiaca TaxID=72124 RepID=A0ACB7ZUM6_9AGAM|nr:kinase-like domain-containing protein [Hygrophoropsis aurantiaca]
MEGGTPDTQCIDTPSQSSCNSAPSLRRKAKKISLRLVPPALNTVPSESSPLRRNSPEIGDPELLAPVLAKQRQTYIDLAHQLTGFSTDPFIEETTDKNPVISVSHDGFQKSRAIASNASRSFGVPSTWERGAIFNINDRPFKLGYEIGSGGFGVVWSATSVGTRHQQPEEVAIKVTNKLDLLYDRINAMTPTRVFIDDHAMDSAKDQVQKEFQVLRKITEAESPFLTPLLRAFSDEDNFYYIMRQYPGNLGQFLRSRMVKTIKPSQIEIWMAELVLAMQELHEMNIVHRDLKPDNILISPSGHLCVADFGLALEMDLGLHERLEDAILSGSAGTYGYMAPEMRGDYDYKVDHYAVGLVMLEMCLATGEPWYGKNDPIRDLPEPRNLVSRLPQFDARELLYKLLDTNARERPSWDAVREMAFFHNIDWDMIERRQYNTHYSPCIHPERMRNPARTLKGTYERLGPAIDHLKKLVCEKALRGIGPGALDIDFTCPQLIRYDQQHGLSCRLLGKGKCFYQVDAFSGTDKFHG